MHSHQFTGYTPDVWQGTPQQFPYLGEYPWVAQLPDHRRIYCAFWMHWHKLFDLPPDYDYYLVSYHTENVNLEWLRRQTAMGRSNIIVLFPGNSYELDIPGVEFLSYIDWDLDLAKMIEWWGVPALNDHRPYKFSAVCNRISQSKVWITTKLLESAKDDSFVILNDYIEEKNVHGWNECGDPELDRLSRVFQQHWAGTTISDGFDQANNTQRWNSDPWQTSYTHAAIHFTNGSFHYSHMVDDDGVPYTYPGPDVDEKTLKALLSGVGLVPCAQFEIYHTLRKLGMVFDYPFDTTWDRDPGNITRFRKIVSLVDDLVQYDANELWHMVKPSSQHNQEYIVKGGFHAACRAYNQRSLNRLWEILE